MKWTYLLLNIFTLSIPLLRSFEPKINFFSKWKSCLPAILIPAFIFIVWDVWFTTIGVWSFNENYISGWKIFNLPIEEVLFFITIPYACLFIYAVFDHFSKKQWSFKSGQIGGTILAMLLLLVGFLNLDLWYTAVNFISCAILLLIVIWWLKAKWIARFFVAFAIILIPFFIVNGILTSLPVVEYNNAENLSLRLGSIPIEDVFYGLSLILSNVTLYELLKK